MDVGVVARLANPKQAHKLPVMPGFRQRFTRVRVAVLVSFAAVMAMAWWLWPGALNQGMRPKPDDGQKLLQLTQQLVLAQEGNAARTALAGLRSELSRLPPAQAVDFLRAQLASGRDGRTGLGFKLAADGSLAEAPTLRTALLDFLTAIDASSAAAVAEEIFRVKASPDEWALALRAVALGNTPATGSQSLTDRTREMLRHEPWRENPSVGFLEAFDVVVFNRDTALVGDLARWVSDSTNRAVAHASFLTLDRLVMGEPAGALEALLRESVSFSGREATLAGYFARGDVSEPKIRRLVESYLLAANRAEEELRAFAGLFPNRNYFISNNLLTKNATPDGKTLVAQDRAALRVVEEWARDPKFAEIRPHIESMRARLAEFVRAAGP